MSKEKIILIAFLSFPFSANPVPADKKTETKHSPHTWDEDIYDCAPAPKEQASINEYSYDYMPTPNTQPANSNEPIYDAIVVTEKSIENIYETPYDYIEPIYEEIPDYDELKDDYVEIYNTIEPQDLTYITPLPFHSYNSIEKQQNDSNLDSFEAPHQEYMVEKPLSPTNPGKENFFTHATHIIFPFLKSSLEDKRE